MIQSFWTPALVTRMIVPCYAQFICSAYGISVKQKAFAKALPWWIVFMLFFSFSFNATAQDVVNDDESSSYNLNKP